jgi:phosphatidylserine/phosphatidylglycerophosphate/cardiolipin synthase-like enzyme
VIIDRALVLPTSANFSHSAENTNIELGLLVADTALAESIESLMRDKHGVLYERV